MTYKENLQQMFPRAGNKQKGKGRSRYGGGCPGHYFEGGLTADSPGCFGDCDACWDAERDGGEESEEDLAGIAAGGVRQT